MITYGVILLIVAVIVWAVGRAMANHIVLIAGQAIGLIGVILLIVGIVLLVSAHGMPGLPAPAAMGALA